MRQTTILLPWILAFVVMATATMDGIARADDPTPAIVADEASIKEWIEQLNSDDFRVRATASENLLAAGEAAIKALTVASKSPHSEVALRAGDILKKLTKPKYMTTASGLKYRIVRASKKSKPGLTSNVTVHYSGWLDDGTEFDSSHTRGQPATFPLKAVIRGWSEGLQLIGEGGVIELVIPPKLGYGERRTGKIPANSTLHFRVELIEIK